MYNNIFKGKLFAYFTQRLGMNEKVNARGWIEGDCPSCGKQDKFGVNIKDNRSKCWTCGYNANPIAIIQEVEHATTYQEVYKILDIYDGSNYYELPAAIKKEVTNFQLPEEFKLVGLYDSYTAKLVEQNLRKRNFSIKRLMQAGVGYCMEGAYKGRIII